jgi:hypothetical protein
VKVIGIDTGSAGKFSLPKIIQKICNLIIMTLKIYLSNIFNKKDSLKCHEKNFKIVGTVKE